MTKSPRTSPTVKASKDRWQRLLRRARWSRQEATEVLQAQRNSGQCIADFARQQGVGAQRLYQWQSRLRGPQGRAAPPPEGPAFVPVRVLPEALIGATDVPVTTAGSDMELLLPQGYRLRLGPTFCAQTLRRLLLALEQEAPC